MGKARVVHVQKESYDVYIGRPSTWGNPYVIGMDGDRDSVIELYETYMRKRLSRGGEIVQKLKDLDGKRLGCYCAPQKCHGDVLVKLIEEFI